MALAKVQSQPDPLSGKKTPPGGRNDGFQDPEPKLGKKAPDGNVFPEVEKAPKTSSKEDGRGVGRCLSHINFTQISHEINPLHDEQKCAQQCAHLSSGQDTVLTPFFPQEKKSEQDETPPEIPRPTPPRSVVGGSIHADSSDVFMPPCDVPMSAEQPLLAETVAPHSKETIADIKILEPPRGSNNTVSPWMFLFLTQHLKRWKCTEKVPITFLDPQGLLDRVSCPQGSRFDICRNADVPVGARLNNVIHVCTSLATEHSALLACLMTPTPSQSRIAQSPRTIRSQPQVGSCILMILSHRGCIPLRGTFAGLP